VIVETDKASLEIPAPDSGTLARIVKKAGDTAEVGEVIAQIAAGVSETAANGREPSPVPEAGAAASGGERSGDAAPRPAQSEEAKEAQKEAEQVTGISAIEGAESEDAVRGRESTPEPEGDGAAATAAEFETPEATESVGEAAPVKEPPSRTEPAPLKEETIEPRAISPAPPRQREREELVPMTPLRRRIAERLVQAQQTAALLTTFNEIDMSRIGELRQQHGQSFQEKHNVKLGLMSFFVKAVVAALKASPQINAEIRGEKVAYRRYYDVGIAVGGGKGLVVPVLRDADRKSFAEIELAIADFARRAREARLGPDELEGGTFTITNGGIYGSLLSTPIVNPPQSAILGMHAIQDRPVVRGGAVVARPMMYVALTYDHRLVDGREAVSFLKYVKELVEEPTRLLFDV
jgi:2-oxoglutarate dehydrogenase E2 component (dihydrolipoamide succinyltransferase)